MYLLDAFRAMDYDRNGLIDCSELWGGLTYLGMDVTPAQVYDIMQTIEPSRVGLISFDDFQRALQLLDDDGKEKAKEIATTVTSLPKIKPRKMKELHLIEKMHKEANRLSPEVLKTVKIKVKAISHFKQVWSTKGTNSRQNVSVWAPEFGKKFYQRNKTRICVGHYVCQDFSTPKKTDGLCILEVTDTKGGRFTGSSTLETSINQVFPHPVRFVHVWASTHTEKPVHGWRPVPPSKDFVALGMVATTEEDPPELSIVRCVPRRWCILSRDAPALKWNDAGLGGRRGSMWTVNRLNLMAFAQGHEKPRESFFDLKISAGEKIYAGDDDGGGGDDEK